MDSATPPGRRAREAGFTLIELLVALTVMAVLAGLAWTGTDSLVRSREATQAALERTQRLSTVLAQWEQDFAAVHESVAAPPLQFDGRTLRLTRQSDGGLRVIAWTLREGAWYRWAGPVARRQGELQQSWLASQQLRGGEPGELKLVEGASAWQVYYWRGNAWTNAQSSGDGVSKSAGNQALEERDDLPDGVRLVLTLATGTLTRDIAVPPLPQ